MDEFGEPNGNPGMEIDAQDVIELELDEILQDDIKDQLIAEEVILGTLFPVDNKAFRNDPLHFAISLDFACLRKLGLVTWLFQSGP